MKVTLIRTVIFTSLFSSAFLQQRLLALTKMSTSRISVIPGQVMENEFALELLARQSELTYQLKLAEYQNELAASIPDILPEFENRDITIVGSIATMDTGIYFYEGIKNLQVIAAENAACFSGLPNSLNDKLHYHATTEIEPLP